MGDPAGVTRQLVTYPGSSSSLKDDTTLVGDLAKSWDVSADGKTYTFHLRDGIRFAGPTTRPIVAKDFVYAIKRFLRSQQAGGGGELL
ncbi:Dipeptide-binding protein [Raoultella terrigena]|uniref:Dipeptide-binding protein n=1 Tax=Raoultella terrigena TaxID=577 RepID=A0A3P8M0D3_RAOTE|nr:Dipeptide-binding protein [Raoultella terrigena]